MAALCRTLRRRFARARSLAMPFATSGVLTDKVKAWCSIKMVSDVSSEFGDPYSTEVPPSSVFQRSLAQNGGWEASLPKVYFYRRAVLGFDLISFVEGLKCHSNVIFRDRCKASDTFSSARQAWRLNLGRPVLK